MQHTHFVLCTPCAVSFCVACTRLTLCIVHSTASTSSVNNFKIGSFLFISATIKRSQTSALTDAVTFCHSHSLDTPAETMSEEVRSQPSGAGTLKCTLPDLLKLPVMKCDVAFLQC